MLVQRDEPVTEALIRLVIPLDISVGGGTSFDLARLRSLP
jgi:hypothetical protein